LLVIGIKAEATGIGITGIRHITPVPNWCEHLHSFSFRYRTDRMPYSPAFTN
jgi:hypothetical protein